MPFIPILVVAGGVFSADPSVIDAAGAVELVRAGYEKTWSQIGAFRATITRTIENSDSAEKEIEEAARNDVFGSNSNGPSLSVVVTPQVYSTSQTLVSDGHRCLFSGSLIAPEASKDQFLLQDGTLTVYHPQVLKAAIWPESKEVGAFRHPRSFAFPFETMTLPTLIETAPAVAAANIDVDGHRRLELRCSDKNDVQWVLRFDPARDFALTRVWKVEQNGSVSFASHIDHEQVSATNGNAWFPKMAEQRVYWIEGVPVTEDLPEGWQQRTQYVVSDIAFAPQVSDDAFKLVYAPGTTVVDETTGKHYDVPLAEVFVPRRSFSTIFIALNIAVILILAVLAVYWRRKRATGTQL